MFLGRDKPQRHKQQAVLHSESTNYINFVVVWGVNVSRRHVGVVFVVIAEVAEVVVEVVLMWLWSW